MGGPCLFLQIDIRYDGSSFAVTSRSIRVESCRIADFATLHSLKFLYEIIHICTAVVEHRTGIAEVTGSNPVEVLIFFRLLLSNCLNWKIYCDDHISLSLHSL